MFLALIALSPLQIAGRYGDYPSQDGAFYLPDAGRLNGTSIVTALRHLEPKTVSGVVLDQEEVAVVNSLSLPNGRICTLLVPRGRHLPVAPLVQGRRYLVIGCASENGEVTFPVGSRLGTDEWHMIAPTQANEVLAIARFDTTQNVISDGPNVRARVENSIADCLVNCSDIAAKQVHDFLWFSTYADQTPSGQGYFPLATRIRSNIQNARPYVRARGFHILNSWRVIGAGDQLTAALRACLREPGAFSASDDSVDGVRYFEPADYPHQNVFTGNDWISEVVQASNRKVRNFFLTQAAPGFTDQEHRRQLASLLADSEARVRYDICRLLAAMNHDQAHAPTYDPNGRSENLRFPGLDSFVTFWRNRYV